MIILYFTPYQYTDLIAVLRQDTYDLKPGKGSGGNDPDRFRFITICDGGLIAVNTIAARLGKVLKYWYISLTKG